VRLAVVVAALDGDDALGRCLDGVLGQQDGPPLRILVPLEDDAPESWSERARSAQAEVVAMGPVATAHPPGSLADTHERVDRRRAAGLAAALATADVTHVALVEDRVVPRADWAAALAREFEAGHTVVGGAVDLGCSEALSAAAYYADYGRYQPPFAAGPGEWISDVNVAYRRNVLEASRDRWEARYQESTLHEALREAGTPLQRSPAPVVDARREGLRLVPLLRERVAFGRVFGAARIADAGLARRLLLAALTPLLPLVLLLRAIRERSARGPVFARSFGRGLAALVLVLAAWSLGELLAYLSGNEA
jgi:hypothetical protein